MLSVLKDIIDDFKNKGGLDKKLEKKLEELDFNYIEKEIPQAISQSLSGIDNITNILMSVRKFSRENIKDKSPVNINQAVESSVLFTKNLWKNSAAITKELAPELPEIITSQGEINQILINIIINAVHAIEEAPENKDKKIHIKTKFDNETVTITISDTGKGISADNLKKIFIPFFTTKTEDKGTGQGLSIVKKIVENNKGSINVKSTENNGTSVQIKFSRPDYRPMEKEKSNSTLLEKKVKQKPVIFFIDDEEDMLLSLKRMLKSKKDSWNMKFLKNPQKALELMKDQPADIIITDYQMDEMNGLDLLKEVKKRYPQTGRIVLSGETDQEIIMKTISIAHQYISKPANPVKLKELIARTSAMQNILKDKGLRKNISKMDSLPSIPSIYRKILKELNAPISSTKKIGEIISKDPSMTSKIIQVVNSGFFYLQTTVSKAEDAVVLLGVDTVRALVLHLEIFSKMKLHSSLKNFQKHLHSHAVETATLSKQLIESESIFGSKADEAFMAGLLHDSGKLVLAANFPKKYKKVIKNVAKNNSSFSVEEKEILGISHEIAGAFLMGSWGLPLGIIEGILYHHTPSESDEDKFGIISSVHIANNLLLEKNNTFSEAVSYDEQFLEKLKLNSKVKEFKKIFSGDTQE